MVIIIIIILYVITCHGLFIRTELSHHWLRHKDVKRLCVCMCLYLSVCVCVYASHYWQCSRWNIIQIVIYVPRFILLLTCLSPLHTINYKCPITYATGGALLSLFRNERLWQWTLAGVRERKENRRKSMNWRLWWEDKTMMAICTCSFVSVIAVQTAESLCSMHVACIICWRSTDRRTDKHTKSRQDLRVRWWMVLLALLTYLQNTDDTVPFSSAFVRLAASCISCTDHLRFAQPGLVNSALAARHS